MIVQTHPQTKVVMLYTACKEFSFPGCPRGCAFYAYNVTDSSGVSG